MIRHRVMQTKILDGAMSLGASFILTATLTVDGGAVPANLTIDYTRGTVTRSDTPDKTVYAFEFDHEIAAIATISAGMTLCTTADTVTISVATNDAACESMTVSVHRDYQLVGNYSVPVSEGVGVWPLTIGVPGIYVFKLTPSLAGTYNRPAHNMAEVVVEVEDGA